MFALLIVLAFLGLLSMALLAWQAVAAARFPLHQRQSDLSFAPPVLLLKPLKGCDAHTAACLRSWFQQQYPGPIEIWFGVAEMDDPVCDLVRQLMREFPQRRAELVHTPRQLGPNAKISNVAQIYCEYLSRSPLSDLPSSISPLLCLSDADVWVHPDFLAQAVQPLHDSQVGLVTSFYQLAKAQNFAMEVEAVAVNADFWSQVLQSNTLKPQDFALGAVMITRPAQIDAIGGFESLVDYLADDYQLGNRIAKTRKRVFLTQVVAQCWDPVQRFRHVWAHQLRWARTIRGSQPVPYFFSIVNNVSLWTTLLAVLGAKQGIYRVATGYPWHFDAVWVTCCLLLWDACLLARIGTAQFLVQRLTGRRLPWSHCGVVLAKDFVQAAIWACAFLGNTVSWRGRTFRIVRGGRLEEIKSSR